MNNKDILKDLEAMAILQEIADKGWTPKMVYTAMNKLVEQSRLNEQRKKTDPREEYMESIEAMYDNLVPLDSDFGASG